QGSRPEPYRITIAVKRLADAERAGVAAAVAESALHVAKLMAGQMPEDIETLFDRAGVSLFPARASELRTDCSCPDWSNPCKHIAAVYYLLGEEFDRDPFLIFRLRGIDREQIVELVGASPRPAARVAAPSPPRSVPRLARRGGPTRRARAALSRGRVDRRGRAGRRAAHATGGAAVKSWPAGIAEDSMNEMRNVSQ